MLESGPHGFKERAVALNPDWTGRELIWQKIPDVSRAREIVIDGETWVRLRRVRRFGSLATVESKAGEWTLKRVGLFRTRITIRVADQELNLALFTPSFAWFGSAGTLEFSVGRVCHWAPTKSFGREHSFSRIISSS